MDDVLFIEVRGKQGLRAVYICVCRGWLFWPLEHEMLLDIHVDMSGWSSGLEIQSRA